MNSSSIVMAFIIAGVVSVVAHNVVLGPVVLGPVVLGPNGLEQQAGLDNKSGAFIKHAANTL